MNSPSQQVSVTNIRDILDNNKMGTHTKVYAQRVTELLGVKSFGLGSFLYLESMLVCPSKKHGSSTGIPESSEAREDVRD